MSITRRLVVIGAGGFAAEMVEAAELAGWGIESVYDDNLSLHGTNICGVECRGTIEDFKNIPSQKYVVAIGNNEIRRRLMLEFNSVGHQAETVIHPAAIVSRSAAVRPGVYVAAGAFVGPRTKIAPGVIVNVGASIGHDASVGPWAQLCPGVRVSGFGLLGEGSFMGSNSVLGPHAVMEEWSQLGASSFAPRLIKARTLCVGVPARPVIF